MMDPAWISLAALALVLFLASREKIAISVVSLAFAWIIGRWVVGLSAPQIAQAFPLQLFLVLFGVTLFFGLAAANGTLDHIAAFAMRFARGHVRALPWVFFLLAFLLSIIGPGNIGAVAMLAPLAIAASRRAGIGAFFTTVMLVSGANAGTLSPFSTTGVIVNTLVSGIGIEMHPWRQVFLPNLLAQSFIALSWYLVLIARVKPAGAGAPPEPLVPALWTGPQRTTGLAIAAFIFGVLVFKADVGFLSISLSALLMIVGVAHGGSVAKVVPWNVLMMVCGVSTFVQVVNIGGGLDLFAGWLAAASEPGHATALLAWVTGLLSSYSSSSGVVVPTFIPMVPALIEKMGGGNAVAFVSSITVGSHVVDISPLSTLGALCLANAAHEDKSRLFNQLLGAGLLMSFYGALVCYLFFGLLMK